MANRIYFLVRLVDGISLLLLFSLPSTGTTPDLDEVLA